MTQLTEKLETFEGLLFGQGIAFDPFSESDIDTYFKNPDCFNLGFKKARGQGILYGLDHVRIRQSFLNDLPKPERLAIIDAKCNHFKLWPKIRLLLAENGQTGLITLLDAEDIGMGHTVLRLTVQLNGDVVKRVVIKREESGNQQFYVRVLNALGWPSYKVLHTADASGQWEISEDLGNDTLQKVLDRNKPEGHSLIRQLAMQAALGDILGRGDRHFENYMVSDNNLIPIDTSFLFWEDNEDWVFKYGAGGMNELAYFQSLIPHADQLDKALMTFFREYNAARQDLAKDMQKLLSLISRHFGTHDRDTKRKKDFVESRLREEAAYAKQQLERYREAFNLMAKRLVKKKALAKHIEDKGQTKLEPILRMYYHADKGRCTTFFLLEDRNQGIQDFVAAL